METKNADKIVLELLQKVEEKKKQIGNAERPSWKTHCSFKFNPDNNASHNIQVISDIKTLLAIYGHILAESNKYYDAIKALSKSDKSLDFTGSSFNFIYLGFSFSEWEHDIKTRISSLNIKTKRDELAKLEERVNSLVSPEQRRQIELEQLIKEIG